MSLNPQFMISPNLQEFFIDPDTNLPLTNGTVTYYLDTDHSTLKPVYELSGSPGSYTFTQLPNPLDLSGAGTPINGSGQDIRVYYNPYDENGNVELYYINVKDEFGNTKIIRQAWPNLSGASGGSANFAYNFVRNSTFYSWSNGTIFSDVGLGSSSLTDFIFDDWTYQQDDASQDIEIRQGVFPAGEESVDFNAPYYLIYDNTDSGNDAGSYNYFAQTYKSVQTLSNTTVCASIWLYQVNDGSAAGQVSLTFVQNFGTGGTPSADFNNPIIMIPSLTIGEWTQYTGSTTVNTIVGKNIGTDVGSDKLILKLNMPIRQTAEIWVGPIRIEEGQTVSGTAELSNDDLQKATNYTGLYPAWTTGDVKMTIKDEAPPGWLMMNNQTIGKSGSNAGNVGFSFYALYEMIWENINSTIWATLFTSAGIVTTYGPSAQSDWDALKQLSLPLALGRAFAGVNPSATAAFTKYFNGVTDVNVSDNSITLNSNSSLYTGTIIEFGVAAGSVLPTTTPQILANTDYAVIQVPATNKIRLATSVAQALTGTPNITINAVGSGQLELGVDSDAYGLASYLGEDLHGLVIPEIPSHPHLAGSLVGASSTNVYGGTAGVSPNFITYGANTQNVTGLNYTGSVTISGSTASTGGSGLHNTIQPTTYLNVMIKI